MNLNIRKGSPARNIPVSPDTRGEGVSDITRTNTCLNLPQDKEIPRIYKSRYVSLPLFNRCIADIALEDNLLVLVDDNWGEE